MDCGLASRESREFREFREFRESEFWERDR